MKLGMVVFGCKIYRDRSFRTYGSVSYSVRPSILELPQVNLQFVGSRRNPLLAEYGRIV